MIPAAIAQGQLDRASLPIIAPKRPTYSELDVRKVKAPPRFEVKAPKKAPNVVIVLIDDLGFGAPSTFGGPIPTPTFNQLATTGLRYNQFHTTALCSPTRTCILTGRNHHSNNMACITEGSTGYLGYNANIPFENGFLSEMLLQNGYNTYAVGKWHLTPVDQVSSAGPYDRWPLGRGFERYYGFLGGDTHQYYPELVYDNHIVEQEKTPEEGYHLTEDLVDKAIGFIADTKQVAPNKPFFMYFATGAMHAPHHVPKEWADKYQGMFDDGWDAYREKTFARQKELGIVPADAELSRHDPDVQDWDSLPEEERRLYARMMEVYAGFLEHTDTQVGRLIDELEALGIRDNTLVIYNAGNTNVVIKMRFQNTYEWDVTFDERVTFKILVGSEKAGFFPGGIPLLLDLVRRVLRQLSDVVHGIVLAVVGSAFRKGSPAWSWAVVTAVRQCNTCFAGGSTVAPPFTNTRVDPNAIYVHSRR